jgi:hypothetical protein
MSWPLKLRAMSLAITIGVTLLESVMGSAAIALALWYFGVASAGTLFEMFAVVSLITSFSISIYSHIRPPIPSSTVIKRGNA